MFQCGFFFSHPVSKAFYLLLKLDTGVASLLDSLLVVVFVGVVRDISQYVSQLFLYALNGVQDSPWVSIPEVGITNQMSP
ncbi:hypothetical protein D3C80_1213740 [compost metagenome]